MRIVALMGSPRKSGSTALLVQELLKGAVEKGAQTSIYYLNDLKIGWCQSCHKCVEAEAAACAVSDDANKILADIQEAGAVVFGTPVYMSAMSGQMKTMLDRMRPFTRKDDTSKMKAGKKAVWAVTQRNPDKERYMPVFEKVMFPMKFLGFAETRLLIASGTSTPERLMKQEETLEKARILGGWLAER
jgi:multimeric flavodoxin WrbA